MRDLNRWIGGLGFFAPEFALSLMASATGCPTRTRIQPNIVFILADDLGWKDAGFMGSRYYETPYPDGLASRGMIFTQAYSAGPGPPRPCARGTGS